jgi:hypothetical protein
MGKILVTEGWKSVSCYQRGWHLSRTDDFSLSYVEGQLVLSFFRQLAQLDAADFTANGWCEIVHLDFTLRQKVRKGWIGVFAMIVVLKRRQWWISNGISGYDLDSEIEE